MMVSLMAFSTPATKIRFTFWGGLKRLYVGLIALVLMYLFSPVFGGDRTLEGLVLPALVIVVTQLFFDYDNT